jgi:hypothetical protein
LPKPRAKPLSKRGFSFGTDRTGRVSNGPIGGRCQENPSAITQRSQTSIGTDTNEDGILMLAISTRKVASEEEYGPSGRIGFISY